MSRQEFSSISWSLLPLASAAATPPNSQHCWGCSCLCMWLCSCERLSLLLRGDGAHGSLPKGNSEEQKKSEQRLSFLTVSPRSAFTPLGMARLWARVIAAGVETEKPLFLPKFDMSQRAEGAPTALPRSFTRARAVRTSPHLFSQHRRKLLCSSAALAMEW